MEEAVKDSDIICVTSTAPVKEIDFPYIAEDWVKKGALGIRAEPLRIYLMNYIRPTLYTGRSIC